MAVHTGRGLELGAGCQRQRGRGSPLPREHEWAKVRRNGGQKQNVVSMPKNQYAKEEDGVGQSIHGCRNLGILRDLTCGGSHDLQVVEFPCIQRLKGLRPELRALPYIATRRRMKTCQ